MRSLYCLLIASRRHIRALRASALLVILIDGACTAPTSPTTTPLSLTRFRSEMVAYLFVSGYDQPTTFVVRDPVSWESTWNQLYRRQTPVPPLPSVDFSVEMIAVAALGSQPTSGYDLVFANASEREGTVTIEVTTRSPAAQCAILPVVTSPVDLARLAKRNGVVQFRFTAAGGSCSS
jgi:hypothetical protein